MKLINTQSKWYFKLRTTYVIKLYCRFEVHDGQANQHAELKKQVRIHYEIYTYAQNPSFHTLQNKLVFYCKVDHFTLLILRSGTLLQVWWPSSTGSPLSCSVLRVHAAYAALWHTADVTTWACWSNSAASATQSDSDSVRWQHMQLVSICFDSINTL